MTLRATPAERAIPAPGLAEVSEIWWDVERIPLVVWDDTGRRYDLVDPEHPEVNRLHLAELVEAPDDPATFATVLAEGLASCDFPPLDHRASKNRVQSALRAARRDDRLV